MPEFSDCAAELKLPAACEIAPESPELAPLCSWPAPVLASVAPDETVPWALAAHEGGGAPLIAAASAWMFWAAPRAFAFHVASCGFGALATPSAYCTCALKSPSRCLYNATDVPAGVAVAAGGCVGAGAAVVAVAIGTAVRVAVGAAWGCVAIGACVATPPGFVDVFGGRVFVGTVVRLAVAVVVVRGRIVGELSSSPPMPNAT
jgi:hypothetical protein